MQSNLKWLFPKQAITWPRFTLYPELTNIASTWPYRAIIFFHHLISHDLLLSLAPNIYLLLLLELDHQQLPKFLDRFSPVYQSPDEFGCVFPPLTPVIVLKSEIIFGAPDG